MVLRIPFKNGSKGQIDSRAVGARASIVVIGVGNGGCNSVSRVYRQRVSGVKYYCINTDEQHLGHCPGPNKIVLGEGLNHGLGTGGDPQTGRQAALGSLPELHRLLEGADLVVISAGMGGGTGTGAAPVVAELAKETGAHVAVVVTEPFRFEALDLHDNAAAGFNLLRENAHTLLTISHNKLMENAERTGESYTWDDVLRIADSMMDEGIQTLVETVAAPSEERVGFTAVKAVSSFAVLPV